MCLGIPGQITAIKDNEQFIATVDVSGVKRDINIACVAETDQPLETCIGWWVLVHVGFAMSRINAQEAEDTLRLLADLGELNNEIDAFSQSTG